MHGGKPKALHRITHFESHYVTIHYMTISKDETVGSAEAICVTSCELQLYLRSPVARLPVDMHLMVNCPNSSQHFPFCHAWTIANLFTSCSLYEGMTCIHSIVYGFILSTSLYPFLNMDRQNLLEVVYA
jgi:hypothetical protein